MHASSSFFQDLSSQLTLPICSLCAYLNQILQAMAPFIVHFDNEEVILPNSQADIDDVGLERNFSTDTEDLEEDEFILMEA